ncbi:MAG: TraB/GumN family protein [Cyclobacteriaceae bacterium]
MKVLIILFLILCSGLVRAQDQSSSLFWEISGNGLEKPSFLYGTIHMICQEDLNMSNQVKEAFAQTTLTVLEVDMDDPNLMSEAQKHAYNDGMSNISELLEESDKDMLNTYFKENYGADLSQLGVMKPFSLISLTLPKLLSCSTASYEQSFVQLSQGAEKELVGLETMDFQMGLFDQIPIEKQLTWLVESVEKTEDNKLELNQMIAAYKNNDLDKLFEVMTTSPEFAEYTDLLLYDRNKTWIPKIEEIIKEQQAFIAVGAGHLASKQGVVELLRAKGYTVKPIL